MSDATVEALQTRIKELEARQMPEDLTALLQSMLLTFESYLEHYDECIDVVAEQVGQFNAKVAARRAEMGQALALLNRVKARLAGMVQTGPHVRLQPTTVWGYAASNEEELWSGTGMATREEAIAAGRREFGPGVHFCIRSGIRPAPHAYVPSTHLLLEQMNELAAEEAGEVVDDFPKPSPEAQNELRERLWSWADEYLGPVDFWLVNGPIEDIAAHEYNEPVPAEQLPLKNKED